jgi:hypothetical protein
MNNTLQIRLPNGYLIATISQDPDYPGIDVEYIDDNEKETDLSRPRVLIEAPVESNGVVRALIWNDPKDEDYTEDIDLYNPNK